MAVAFRPAEVLELEFAVRSEERNGAVQLWLSGELDLAGIPLLTQELDRLRLQGRGVEAVDLTELVFIDAVGLHAVMAVGDGVSNGRRRPALVGARPAVSRVFELVGLEHHLGDRR